MLKEMNRREFLKTSAATGAVLMAGDVLKGGATVAYGSVKIPEVEKLVITVITDNYYDCLAKHGKIARRSNIIIPGVALHAEHGLAYYIETVVNGKTYTFMFDFGWDFNGVSRNIELLNLDLRRLDALVLSHGHLDHFGNLIQILKYNSGKISKGIPLYLGGEAYARRYVNLATDCYDPGGFTDLGQFERDEVDSLGVAKIVEVKDPTPVVPGAYLTGNVERVTEYEKGSPILFIKRGDKKELDLFMGEQSLVFNVKGKGLVVVSSCAHAGIVNTVKHAQKMTGIDKVHTVIGGFHLTGAPMPKIQKTVADIKAINTEYIVPMHCSGWEAITGFEREMPKQFVLNMAGTRYVITA